MANTSSIPKHETNTRIITNGAHAHAFVKIYLQYNKGKSEISGIFNTYPPFEISLK